MSHLFTPAYTLTYMGFIANSCDNIDKVVSRSDYEYEDYRVGSKTRFTLGPGNLDKEVARERPAVSQTHADIASTSSFYARCQPLFRISQKIDVRQAQIWPQRYGP